MSWCPSAILNRPSLARCVAVRDDWDKLVGALGHLFGLIHPCFVWANEHPWLASLAWTGVCATGGLLWAINDYYDAEEGRNFRNSLSEGHTLSVLWFFPVLLVVTTGNAVWQIASRGYLFWPDHPTVSLLYAVQTHNTQLVRDHLYWCRKDGGCDVNALVQIAPNAREMTLLHFAVRDGDSEIVKLLLDAGSDANIPDAGGVTSLDLAAFMSRSGLVRLLQEHTAAELP